MDLTTQGSTSADAGSTAKAVHTYLLTPGNGTVEIDIACEAPKLKTLMFSPEHQALVALDQCDCEIIDTETAELDALVEALNDAQQHKLRAQEEGRGINRAKITVRAAKAALRDRLEALSSGSGAGANTWYELHSIETAGQVRFVPGNILDAADRNRFFRLVDEPDAENAFKSFRDADGNIDASKFKNAFTETSASIKAEWKLVDETGQVPTRVLANAVSPAIASLLNDELEALDSVIAEWNKTLNWQTQQYQSQHERAVKYLKEDPFSHELFGRAKVLCQQIWQDDSPINGVNYDAVSDDDNIAARQRLADIVAEKPLPPARWTASAEANLMRYSKGVTVSANFDPLKGVLAGEAKAEFEFALAEARLEGSVYYPHEEGLPVGPRVRVKTRSHRWAVFDRCLPDNVHFDTNSEFMRLYQVGELVSAFGHWGLLKRTLNDRYKLMILGHTDLVGENDYNQALSLRRAQVAYGLLTRNPTPWVGMFELGYWGETERQYMIEHSSGQESDPPHNLIQRYFEGCENRFALLGNHLLPQLTDQAFAMTYLIPRGELEPVINVETQERMNRRVEFVVLEAVEETVETVDRKLDLGHMRAKFEGQVSGFAGVNLSLAAEVSVDVSGGELTLANKDDVQEGNREQASTSVGGAQAEAFIGAKIEAGLAAELDWKQPQGDEQSQQGEGQDFLALGTVGYLVSGHVGLALNGKFKVGFDREIKRFVIKLEASLCLGPGVGGKFEATVDAKQVWNFISLVHHQLLSQDFNWVDMFEDGVYDRFVAWSYELINKGYWFPGLQLRAGAEIAYQAISLLDRVQSFGDDFYAYEENSESLHALIQYISQYSVELKYAPPEVKGRILYRLINEPRHIWRDWSFGVGIDMDQPRERAVLHLLRQGVETKREYLEVLEHTLGESRSGRSLSQRCQDASDAQQALMRYMSDREDLEGLANWWDSLPDVSQCTCSLNDLTVNPFNR
ncbi:MAG: hypothetical protein ABJ000_19810 [Saccharospirillum sp.]|uniref:hypothetical protein n=1 Tax=Saccharospirillum sp. TaxID=2033801 RepID=UPI0032975636